MTQPTPPSRSERSVSYLILQPERLPVLRPGPRKVSRGARVEDILAPGGPGRTGGVIHLDLETRGTDPLDPDAEIMTVGIANANGVWVWDPREWEQHHWDTLHSALSDCTWAAFNVMFDGAWLAWKLGGLPPIDCCTFVLFRLLANEDWPRQRWRLEIAQSDILEWPDTNKGRLQELMWANGFSNKGEMWRLADLAPAEFQRYCAEDADASWQLRNRLEQLTKAHAGEDVWASTWQLARQEWSTMLKLHIKQQLRGVHFAVDDAKAYYDQLRIDIRRVEGKLRDHPKLAPHVAAWERALLKAAATPSIKIRKLRATKADREAILDQPDWVFYPSAAKSLPAWQADEGGYWAKEVAEVTTPEVGAVPRVNWESDAWLRWLLWGAAPKNAPADAGPGGCFAANVELRPTEKDGREVQAPHFISESGAATLIPTTESGQMPVGKAVLPMLGEVGELLLEASALTKRRGYVASYVLAERDGVLHPRMRAHGTSTGRMSGGSSS